MAARTVEKFNQAGRDTVVTWCPSCHMNMDDLMAPATEAAFETQHITQLLAARGGRLRPLLTNAVRARVLLHAHYGFHGRVPVNADVPMLLRMIPGLTVLDHPLRVPGHMCSAIAPKPGLLTQTHRETLAAMEEIGADTLVTIFHSCHREAVSLERARQIRVVNWIHLLAEAMGLPYTDEYKLWRNADDPRAAIGAERIMAAGDAAFEQLVDPELRRPPTV
jgi:Fe-S oxidoreductase